MNNISKTWVQKFDLIEKAGGEKLKNIKNLSRRERMKINFNFLAFVFGPFYYLSKGMWKKAIIISIAGILIALILFSILASMNIRIAQLGVLTSAWFASRANVDYYLKIVKNDNDWW